MAKRISGRSSARRRAGPTRLPRSKAARAKHDATRAFHNRIAVVFDWDERLGPTSFDYLLESYGVDAARFRKERVRPLAESGTSRWPNVLPDRRVALA
jgi:hypothetical protein